MKKLLILAVFAALVSCSQGPLPPQLIQPLDGSALLAHYPFIWTAVPGAQEYLLEIGPDATFSSVIISEAVADTFHDITNNPELSTLQPGFIYYWQVRSGDGKNWGNPSSYRTFHILQGGKP